MNFHSTLSFHFVELCQLFKIYFYLNHTSQPKPVPATKSKIYPQSNTPEFYRQAVHMCIAWFVNANLTNKRVTIVPSLSLDKQGFTSGISRMCQWQSVGVRGL
jgi:hypothetical protein